MKGKIIQTAPPGEEEILEKRVLMIPEGSESDRQEEIPSRLAKILEINSKE